MDPRAIPIPDMTLLRVKRRGAREHPVDISASENFERAVDVRTVGIAGENYYHRESGNPPYEHRAPCSIPELYVREGLVERLLHANELLASYGYEVFLFDAYRPVEVQNYFFDEWVPSTLRAEHPDWTEEEIDRERRRYWAKGAPSSNEVDPLSPPPHATGGVLDLSLRFLETEELLFMGSPFDAIDESSYADHFERIAMARTLLASEEEALRNRRLLYWTMREAGLVANPNEWWHYGYGDQLSSILSGVESAVYSKMDII
jgi:D-alanyl-D-alanine dipeptidase